MDDQPKLGVLSLWYTYAMKITHNCQHCGETNPSKFYPRMKSNCKDCHNKHTWLRMESNVQYAKALYGNKCSICGYNKCTAALDFHHVDPSTKDPNFKRSRGWSRDRLLQELKRCILVCANCHREIHFGPVAQSG